MERGRKTTSPTKEVGRILDAGLEGKEENPGWRQKMATLSKTTLMGFLLFLSACTSSKVLNESRAKALIGEALQQQVYNISAASITSLMSRSTTDYRATTVTTGPAFALKRLIEEKLVTQKIEVLNYPKISGTFVLHVQTKSGDWLTTTDSTINIGMVPATNSLYGSQLTIKTSKAYFGGGTSRDTDTFKGTVDPNGRVYLTLPRYTNGFRNGEGIEFLYREEGKTAYLDQKGDQGIGTFTGTASGQRVELRWYEYTFSPEVQTSAGRQVIEVAAGRLQVGEVSNLQLVNETHAVANFAWQAQLNKLGQIMLGDVKPSGTSSVQFAKNPDGTWVLTSSQ